MSFLTKTQPTGVFPNGGGTSRWSYMRDGRGIWSGSEEECLRRYRIVHQVGEWPTSPKDLLRAIRAV